MVHIKNSMNVFIRQIRVVFQLHEILFIAVKYVLLVLYICCLAHFIIIIWY